MSSGRYHEMIVVASSEYLEINNEYFFEYHLPWTNYLLSDSLFQFDKVIYVCEKSGKTVLVYDKEKPLEVSPKRDKDKEVGITHCESSFIPFGKEVNISHMFENEPIIPPKNKCKKERKKNKAECEARKVNRKKK